MLTCYHCGKEFTFRVESITTRPVEVEEQTGGRDHYLKITNLTSCAGVGNITARGEILSGTQTAFALA